MLQISPRSWKTVIKVTCNIPKEKKVEIENLLILMSCNSLGHRHYATVPSHHGAQLGVLVHELRTMQQPQCRNEGELKAIDSCAMQRNGGNLIFLKNRAQITYMRFFSK
jgi:hypothetical protein